MSQNLPDFLGRTTNPNEPDKLGAVVLVACTALNPNCIIAIRLNLPLGDWAATHAPPVLIDDTTGEATWLVTSGVEISDQLYQLPEPICNAIVKSVE